MLKVLFILFIALFISAGWWLQSQHLKAQIIKAISVPVQKGRL